MAQRPRKGPGPKKSAADDAPSAGSAGADDGASKESEQQRRYRESLPSREDYFGEAAPDERAGWLPDQTWTLDQGAHALSRGQLVERFQQALREWKNLGSPPIRGGAGIMVPRATEGAWREFWRGDEDRTREEMACIDLGNAELSIDEVVRSAIARGAISVWARKNDGDTSLEIVKKTSMLAALRAVFQYIDSQIQVPTKVGRVTLSDVRLRPWLHVPDVVGMLSGLSLAVAFERYVRDDAEVLAVLQDAETCSDLAYPVLLGHYSAREPLWPMTLAAINVASEWRRLRREEDASFDALADKSGLHEIRLFGGFEAWGNAEDVFQPPIQREVLRAASIVKDRIERLLAPLRSGTLAAWGHYRSQGERTEIPRSTWAEARGRLDFVRSELHGPDGVEWRGIELRIAPKSGEEVGGPLQSSNNKGGRPLEYPWDSAFESVLIELIGKNEPETSRELRELLIKAIDAKGGRFRDANPRKGSDPSERKLKGSLPDVEQVDQWLRERYPTLVAHLDRPLKT